MHSLGHIIHPGQERSLGRDLNPFGALPDARPTPAAFGPTDRAVVVKLLKMRRLTEAWTIIRPVKFTRSRFKLGRG